MNTRSTWAIVLLVLAGGTARSQEPVVAPGDKEPILRVEAGGPTSFVRALAAGPDGQTFYVGGYDKVVRVYTTDPHHPNQFVLNRVAYRVPVGPGLDGLINAVAISPDGTWLAVAGMGVVREAAGFRRGGLLVPRDGRLTPAMWQDLGTIWIFNTKTQAVHPLRGHRGPVVALAFAPGRAGKPPLLLSAAEEADTQKRTFAGVVRLWDVTQVRSEDAFLKMRGDIPLPSQHTAPGLSLWHTGPEATQVQAAIAWGSGDLLVWDAARGGVWKVTDGSKYNNTAVYFLGPKQLATTSYVNGNGTFQLWDVGQGQGPVAVEEGQVKFPPKGEVQSFPRALTLFSGRADGPADHAAVVLRVGATQGEYRLALLKLGGAGAPSVEKSIPLWKGGTKLPVVTAAPGSKFLAVAGNDDQEVWIYGIEDLLQGRATPQKLHSAGSTMKSVAFVRKGKDLGLVMSESTPKAMGKTPVQPGENDLILNLNGRFLTDDTAGWDIDKPDLAGWKVVHDRPADQERLAVYQGDKLIHRLTLKPLYAVTDYALLPPRKPLNIPILAVAYLDDKGQPWLYLYNGATGEPFRQLYGHTDLIRAVAFSGDGRLLVSAAADQTVSVWSLTNLEKLVGQRGMVWGVAVREENHHLVAASVDKDGPGQGVLQEGDVIEGLVTNNQLRALATPGDYYDALSLLKPGTQVTLRIQGKKDVQLPLGQALNQRKPLFSLFITRAARAQDREWIGWNPIGPYEASDRKTERLIGWHINTGDPVRPTTFATADQYRKELYREGILRFLAARGDLSPALHDWEQEDSHKKLPEPKRNVWIDEIGPGKVDGKGQILIQHLPVTLKVRIDDFPLDKVASVTWQQVGAGGPQALEAPLGSEWSANLSALPWKRGGLYSIRVLVRTREAVPQEFPNDLLLRYQPPPPVIAWGGAPVAPAGVPLETATPRVTVDQPDYTFQAQVQPGSEGEAVKVRLTHTLHQQKPATYDEGAAIHQKLQLRPGENRIEVVAENQNALAGDEDFETSRFSLLVVYVPREVKKAPPPRIDLAQIVLRPGGSEEVLPIPAGQPVVVHSPRLRIVGRIQAEEPIQKAEWMKEGAREWTRLDGFAAGKTELPINQEVEGLEAKKQTFRFVAQTATSDEAEAVVTLDYRPRLPQLLLIQPALEMTLADEGQGDPPVQLDWQVQTDNEEPFEAVVLLDEKPEANPPAYNKAVGTLTARIAVSGPGDHQVQVQVKNSWETLLTPPFHIRVIRPPLVTYENPAADTKPVTTARALINLNFQVTSVLPLLPETVRLEVNGTERKVAVTLPDRQGEGQTGLLRLQDVPLDPGVNQVQLWVSNAEGECRNPGTAAVVYAPPVQRPAPPEIEILEPRETTVTEDQVLIRGRIKSAVPLKKVEVVREGDHPFRDALNVANLKPNADGYYLFEEQVPLVPQANRIRVAAVNEGGPADAQVAVTYLYFPVRLAIKSLKPHGKEANPVAPIELANGGILVAPMSTGRVQLTGSVLAGKLDAGQLKKVNYVRVFVNGFQQVPAQIQPAEDASQLERPFQAELLLNQPVNRIELELADLKAEAGTRTEFNLTCSQPQAGQRLHYLVMAVGEKDPEQLKKEAFQAIGAVADARGEYHTPAFQEVHLYGPLTGFVRPETVFTQLTIIKKTIDLLAHQGSATDVVLVYYQGDEAITPNGHFFKTSLSKYDPVLERSAITCAGLENYYLETLGAKITWLDVARDLPDQAQPPGELKDQVVRWNEESRSAVWRSSWVKGSSSNLNRRWLLTALDEEVPGKRALGQVAAGVGNLFQTQFPRELSYLMKNPDTYQTLVVGPGS